MTLSGSDNDSMTSSDKENEGRGQIDLGQSFHLNFMREKRGSGRGRHVLANNNKTEGEMRRLVNGRRNPAPLQTIT